MAPTPEAQLLEFLVVALRRKPARHKLKPNEHRNRGRLKRDRNGELVYPAPFRMREQDYDHLCYLANQVAMSWGLGAFEFKIKETE